jgi:putative ABC transport system permease protein
MPAMPPNSLKKTASVKNWVRISRRVAPMALRMPISLIRSETETSIIFIIPIPATTNAITLTEKANNLIPSENGFKLFAFSVSVIALVVAGIGIMNIMLVSVSERIKEIGIRKAIGATRRDILTQFLTEAVFLSEFGGIAGIILGVAGGNAVAAIFKIPAVIPLDWAFIGLAVCSVIGIGFGIYPAWKAANMDPIESLRYE